MISLPAIRPAWTIAHAIWQARQSAFLALLSATLLCGLASRLMPMNFFSHDALDALAYLPMGLSIFLTFILCNFTETDKRGKFTGFPSRLFTLPVSTRTLIAAPVLFGIAVVFLVYAMWAMFVLPPLGRRLPLMWPGLYLATGMTCYLTIIWALARFRLPRILALGIGGTILAIGWMVFRDDSERTFVSSLIPIPDDMAVRPILCSLLAAMSAGSFLTAYLAVESQRRGGSGEFQGVRRAIDFVADALPRRRQNFNSPSSAQLWYEWRRHGTLLPLSVIGVLTVIMAVTSFLAPLSEESTSFVLAWILITPLLLAFAIGKGFGKADLWSKEAGLSFFLGTRPLSNETWIGAKMKAAALAALSSWTIILLLATVWICRWADLKPITNLWGMAALLYPPTTLYALPPIVFLALVLFTWRLLVGSLYIGLSGKTWMLGAAAVGVFLAIFVPLFAVLAASQHPLALRNLITSWLPWPLAGLFAVKVATATSLTIRAEREDWVTSKAVNHYLAVWIAGTVIFGLAIWLLIPVAGWFKWTCLMLALYAMPLLGTAIAPIALARNRKR